MNWNSKNATSRLDHAGFLAQKGQNLLLSGARVIDPVSGIDSVLDIFIEKGKIRKVGKIKKADLPKHRAIDLRGKIVAPGFIDLHVHLREPGREDKETIWTGTNAAAAGGFTAVACMPNTDPPLDNAGVVKWVLEQAEEGPVGVFPVAAVTVDRSGKNLSDIGDLHLEAGVRMISDDGSPVADADVMRTALEYCQIHDIVISTHSEEKALAGKGVMREGEWSTNLGLPGWPSVAESVMVARDLLLAEFTGGRLHIGHISSKESIDLVRWAKARGVRVTCEATPHHIALTDEAVSSFSGNFKMNPPLGTKEDRDAVIKGLKDGTIDAIATDHAPHTIEESMVEYSLAPNGVVGLETAIGVVAKELVAKKVLDWPDVVLKMAVMPREILRLNPATIVEGADADLTIIDPDAIWAVDPEKFLTKGRNTPFGGWQLPAKSIGIVNRGWLVLAPDARMLAS